MNIIQILEQLSPDKRALIESMVTTLAQQDGLNVEATGDTHPDPAMSIPFWKAAMVAEGKSPRTIDMYTKDAARYLEADPHPSILTVQAYMAGRMEAGVSAARISSEQKALKSLFNFLHEQGLWASNPTAKLRLVHEPRKERYCPSEEVIGRLLDARLARRKDEDRFRVMLVLLMYTGLRITEARSILRKDIDLGAQLIKVMGKGSKERYVPMSKELAMLLDGYMRENPVAGHGILEHMKGSPYLFPGNTHEGYWDISGFQKMLLHVCQRLDIMPRVTPHMLRHYFATKALDQGLQLKTVSLILGHASVGITGDVYQHVSRAKMQQEYEQFDPLAGIPKRLPEGREEGGKHSD